MKKKVINISIEARMTSSRLPGKVLKEICGKPVLELMIERVKLAKYVDNVIVATTTNATDDPIIELCEKLKIPYFRGSENDVLNRVYLTHKEFQSDVVVELTGDCPLLDPLLIDQCILSYLLNDADYVATSQCKTYPIGQAVEVFSMDILQELNDTKTSPEDREHVSISIYQTPEKYSTLYIDAKKNHFNPELRITLDTQEDLELITKIFEGLYYENPKFDLEDIINYCKK